MPPNSFQLAVNHRLIDLGKNKAWLCREVTAKCGRYCDYTSLRRVLSGNVKRTPIAAAIREILDLPEE